MSFCKIENLKNVSSIDFEEKINDLKNFRLTKEIYNEQRLQSQIFSWGHNHDFGSISLTGEMGSRHIEILKVFIDEFGIEPKSLNEKDVLDVGCWTGGTSLLLAAMGANVTAIDEVEMYTRIVKYLNYAFGIESIKVEHKSLYKLNSTEYFDNFDYVLFAGVLYHITDPVIGLRIIFNCLRNNGKILIETTSFKTNKPMINFARRRWNWFDLSPLALLQILKDVGFQNINIGKVTKDNRLYAVATKISFKEMRKDGLSVPDIK